MPDLSLHELLTLCPCHPHAREIPSSHPAAPKPTHGFAPSTVTRARPSPFSKNSGQGGLGHLPLHLLGRGVKAEPPQGLPGQEGLPGAGHGGVRGSVPVPGVHVGHHRLLQLRPGHRLWPQGYFRRVRDGLVGDISCRTDTQLGDGRGPKSMRDSCFYPHVPPGEWEGAWRSGV